MCRLTRQGDGRIGKRELSALPIVRENVRFGYKATNGLQVFGDLACILSSFKLSRVARFCAFYPRHSHE
ncbi:MAG: hypothetical protein COZ43_09030 [Sphingomonadales bacterium CG_4_10_14_3_um_filter_58_15]|nr:MAG: hypothetical protein COZ43_09030 [Sphingomonadales bacterium CG_4_10_14_3_um_filter_58_15]